VCRFLIIKSTSPIGIDEFLKQFAQACFLSRTPDGDWQGDGWGISYLSEDGQWLIRKSLLPIWSETEVFNNFPKSRFFLVHARSASFPNQKGLIDFNQPFISSRYAFVFNGFIKGMSFPQTVQGNIGSQKLWSMLLKLVEEEKEPDRAILRLKEICLKKAKKINALNIGFCDQRSIYGLCYYECWADYYSLYATNLPSLSFISSEKLAGFESQRILPGELVMF